MLTSPTLDGRLVPAVFGRLSGCWVISQPLHDGPDEARARRINVSLPVLNGAFVNPKEFREVGLHDMEAEPTLFDVVSDSVRHCRNYLSAFPTVGVERARGNNTAIAKGQRMPPPAYISTTPRTASCMTTMYGSKSLRHTNRPRNTTTIARARTTQMRTLSVCGQEQPGVCG